MQRILTIVDDARPLSPCHDAFVIHDRLLERGHVASIVELRDPAISLAGRNAVPRLQKTEPTALAAGFLRENDRLPEPEASACGSLESSSSDPVGVNIIRWPKRFSWSGIQQLRRLIQEQAPDEIHLWGDQGNLLIQFLASLARCPIRRIIGNETSHVQSNATSRRGSGSRKIQPVSRIGGERGGYLPWFGYLMDSSRGHREEVRTRLGVPKHARLVGTIGPFSTRSGIKDFMWAGDLMRCIRDDVYWIVLGNGPQRWRLNRFASQLEVSDRLQVLDYRDDILEIVAALDVYVQPSTWPEDLSGLRAAVSANVPAVGISNSVHQRLISHHQTGYLVERGARNEIARCVNRFVSEPAVADEFRANIPAWSNRTLCNVDEAIDRFLTGSINRQAQRVG